ncbi:MmcQ/YjbR family DNA-binding protein [Rhodocaloribacter sp.]
MDVESLYRYCHARKGVTEGMPFGEGVLVFKVMGKMFALINLTRLPLSVNLKCDPLRALDLRERYEAIEPGYHMNKKHWNTLRLDGDVPADLVRELVDHSYELVAAGLKKADREALARL